MASLGNRGAEISITPADPDQTAVVRGALRGFWPVFQPSRLTLPPPRSLASEEEGLVHALVSGFAR